MVSQQGRGDSSAAGPDGASVVRFRRLVLWFGAVYVLSNLLPLSSSINAALLPPGAAELLGQNGKGALLFAPPIASFGFSIVFLAIVWGVYSMSAQALRLFLFFSIFTTCLALVEGLYVGSPVPGFLGYPTVLLQGAVLGVGYLSDVRTRLS